MTGTTAKRTFARPRCAPVLAVVRNLVLGLLAVTLLAPDSRADDYDLWYVLEMQGQRAGWMHMTQMTEGDRIRQTTETKMELKRGRLEMTISMSSESVETLDGKPISIKSTQKLADIPTTTEFIFGESEMTVVSTQGGKTTPSTKPLPEGKWLPPAAAARFVEMRMAAGADPIVVRTVDPSFGTTPIVITRSNFTETAIDVVGKRIPAVRCTSTTTFGDQEVPGVEFLDKRGTLLRTTVTLGGIEITTLASEREIALAEMDPPEMMQSTFIHPDRAIPNARRTTRASYVLHVEEGEIPELPSTGVQYVERLSERALRVVVDMDKAVEVPIDETTDGAFTEASVMVDMNDERVRELMQRATRGAGKSPTERAEAMRRFVHRYIDEKNLGVGFATASETARTREGDCSEHGTLLAALLRADGIPSRVASGVIYADSFAGSEEIFGYHMWTQALLEVDGQMQWLDLDATLRPSTPFDATHITIAVTPLSDGEVGNAMFTLAPLLGRLQISVESFE